MVLSTLLEQSSGQSRATELLPSNARGRYTLLSALFLSLANNSILIKPIFYTSKIIAPIANNQITIYHISYANKSVNTNGHCCSSRVSYAQAASLSPPVGLGQPRSPKRIKRSIPPYLVFSGQKWGTNVRTRADSCRPFIPRFPENQYCAQISPNT